MKRSIKIGEIKKVGKLKIITQSHKSKPGDGAYHKGVKGGGFTEIDFYA